MTRACAGSLANEAKGFNQILVRNAYFQINRSRQFVQRAFRKARIVKWPGWLVLRFETYLEFWVWNFLPAPKIFPSRASSGFREA